MSELKDINIRFIEPNKGQLEGVPKNPRRWSEDDVDLLAVSIRETPELLYARPLIVVPKGEKYIVLGGNLRLSALKKLGESEARCCVMKNISPTKMKEIVMKDNSSFGDWDVDELANQWDDLPLGDWGVNVGGVEVAGEGIAVDDMEEGGGGGDEEKNISDEKTMTFKLSNADMEKVDAYFKGKDPRTEVLKLVNYGGE